LFSLRMPPAFAARLGPKGPVSPMVRYVSCS
jgi:hypothetical protein